MADYEVCGAGGQVKVNVSYRLLVWYEGKLCPIVRFAVARDGSINFSPNLPTTHEVATQVLNSGPDGSLHVKYGTGTPTAKEDLPGKNALKINYHASGHIHYGPSKAFAKPLRELDCAVDLARMLIMHPTRMGLIEQAEVRKTDMVTDFRADPDYPVQVIASVSPTSLNVPLRSGGRQFWTQMLLVSDLRGVPDLRLIFYIFDGPKGPWPPECGVLMRADPAASGSLMPGPV